MRLGLSADELLSTTRAVRKRLDFDRPVDRDVVLECLRLAVQAPNGSNRQGWEWVLIDAEPERRAIAEIYRENFERLTGVAAAAIPAAPQGDHVARNNASGAYLAANLHRCPLIVVPCVRGRLDGLSAPDAAGAWGSVLPAVWSLQLALRERGLGSAWTTTHLRDGGERRVADVVGIPADSVTQVGLLPVAHTLGTRFAPAERTPVEEVVHWNSWTTRPWQGLLSKRD
jgi:nitroreductase